MARLFAIAAGALLGGAIGVLGAPPFLIQANRMQRWALPNSVQVRTARWQLRCVLLVYALSFCLPAVRTNGNFGTIWGVHAFFGGWVAIIDLHPYWLANPAFWYAAFAFRDSRWRVAAIWGAIACLFACAMPVVAFVESWQLSPPPDTYSLLMPGFYLWLASFVGLALMAVCRLWRSRSRATAS